MEDLKQRLKFDDVAVRSRCVQKLVQAVKKKSKGELITASSVQIPELNLLWEVCIEESTSTSNLAIRGIIYLATNKHLDIDYVTNKFLSSLSSSSNVYNIVKGITRLLILQSNQLRENNRSPYSLRIPKHPLIAVLQADEDYLPLVLESIADAISENNLRGFQVMEPTLLDTVKNEPRTAFYILRCIPLLQIEDYSQVVEAANFIFKAQQAFSSLQSDENDRIYISELLLLSTLSLSERSVLFGHDPARLLHIAVNANFVSSYINLCLVSVAKILKTVSGELIERYITLAVILLNFPQISPTVAALLASSVIQLLPEPCVVSFDEISNSSLSQLLAKLEQSFLDCENVKSSIPSAEAESSKDAPSTSTGHEKTKNDNPIYIESFTSLAQSSLQCANFALKLDESNLEFKLNWLKSVQNIVESCETDNLDVIFSLVAALFLISLDDHTFIKSCLDTFESILKKNSFGKCKILLLSI
ncbi:DUF3730 domain-containing protein [Caerostris extrusa]|uniref:DUF3730 domain-containing protein n=1 Tax=Caerostris extrusa TaxID=172846 RepID=A0AAV4R9J3_CAEEX|nr:DUF3730 domain-containing protein [Caerostris extrusa]